MEIKTFECCLFGYDSVGILCIWITLISAAYVYWSNLCFVHLKCVNEIFCGAMVSFGDFRKWSSYILLERFTCSLRCEKIKELILQMIYVTEYHMNTVDYACPIL